MALFALATIDSVAMERPASSIAADIYQPTQENIAISAALHPPKFWEQFFDEVYFILNLIHLKNFFNHINNLYQHIKFNMEEKSNAELTCLDTSLKRNKGSLYWHIGSLNILTNA